MNSTSLLQAISFVNDRTTWISGHSSTFLRTIDGGQSWDLFAFRNGKDTLQFRDLHGFSENEVILMSSGPGDQSRIIRFHMEHGFDERFRMKHPEGFLNSLAFWKNGTGLAFGDSFGGELFLLRTMDHGLTWLRIDPAELPVPAGSEGGFAASGTCIEVAEGGHAWIATGAGDRPRVLYSSDYGETWTTFETPIVKGSSAGITSIRMTDDDIGLIVGGDLSKPNEYTNNVAISYNRGIDWSLVGQTITSGPFYGSDIRGVDGQYLLIVCGPNGIDYSSDLGISFTNLDTTSYWAVELSEDGYGYATGPSGKILRLDYFNN